MAGAEVCDNDSPDCSPLCACNVGFHLEGGICTNDFLDCEVLFGTGVQTWDGSAYGLCLIVACDSGWHLDGDACVGDTQACTIANGTGSQQWVGTNFGPCQPVACDADYHLDGDACVSDIQSCSIANGTGQQRWDGASFGDCQIVACDAGFGDCNAFGADGCEANTASDVNNCGSCGTVCAAPNAIELSCSNYACTPTLCLGDYHLELSACLSDTRACTMEAGVDAGVVTASQRWTGSAYGSCNAQSCALGYSLGFLNSFPSGEFRTICQLN